MGALRDQILSAEDLPRERVATPEWAAGGVEEVWIRGFSAAERDDYEQGLVERTHDGRVRSVSHVKNLRAAFVVRVLVDEAGERVFSDKDAAALGEKSGLIIDRLWDKGRELSGMKAPEEDEDANPSQPEEPNSSG